MSGTDSESVPDTNGTVAVPFVPDTLSSRLMQSCRSRFFGPPSPPRGRAPALQAPERRKEDWQKENGADKVAGTNGTVAVRPLFVCFHACIRFLPPLQAPAGVPPQAEIRGNRPVDAHVGSPRRRNATVGIIRFSAFCGLFFAGAIASVY